MTFDLETNAWAEVVARHAFFVDWFTGQAPESAMEDTTRCFAPDFHMIAPDGGQLDRDAVLSMLQGAGGSRKSGPFAIEVEMRRTIQPSADLALIVYDELQRTDAGRTARRSTALFSPDADAPGGVVWRHLHESWITANRHQ